MSGLFVKRRENYRVVISKQEGDREYLKEKRDFGVYLNESGKHHCPEP